MSHVVHVLCVCNADTDGFVQLLLCADAITNKYIPDYMCAVLCTLCLRREWKERDRERERGGICWRRCVCWFGDKKQYLFEIQQ